MVAFGPLQCAIHRHKTQIRLTDMSQTITGLAHIYGGFGPHNGVFGPWNEPRYTVQINYDKHMQV